MIYLKNLPIVKNILANLSKYLSRWSIISLPPGYRRRAIVLYRDELLSVKVLHSIDFIIAKLRRFTEEDIKDVLFVVKKFKINSEDILKAGKSALKISPKDSLLYIFEKNLPLFIRKIKE